MAVDKYDIPYAMKPKGRGKDKGKDRDRDKSKYTAYIKTQKKSYFNSLSPDARKLLIYVTFFSIFAYVFLTTLRSSQVPDSTDYELDLDYSNSRERNLIDDSLGKVKTKESKEDVDIEEDEVEEVEIEEVEVIDSLASDEDEISGDLERKTIKKAKKEGNNKDSDFETQLDEMLEQSNNQLKGKEKNKLSEKNEKIKYIPKEEIKRQPKKGKKY